MATELYHGPHTELFLEEIKQNLQNRVIRKPLYRTHGLGFVLGNGESRRSLNLSPLYDVGPVYGCNALYREFTPDVLFTMDEGMTWEVLQSGYNWELVYRIHNSNPWQLKVHNTGEIIEDFGWAAGPTALKYMCLWEAPKQIFLVGFDLYGVKGKINNLYKDTPCYASSDEIPTYNHNWIRSLTAIFEEFPEIYFSRVGPNESDNPKEWEKCKNVFFIDMEKFWSMVNSFSSSIK